MQGYIVHFEHPNSRLAYGIPIYSYWGLVVYNIGILEKRCKWKKANGVNGNIPVPGIAPLVFGFHLIPAD